MPRGGGRTLRWLFPRSSPSAPSSMDGVLFQHPSGPESIMMRRTLPNSRWKLQRLAPTSRSAL